MSKQADQIKTVLEKGLDVKLNPRYSFMYPIGYSFRRYCSHCRGQTKRSIIGQYQCCTIIHECGSCGNKLPSSKKALQSFITRQEAL